MSDRPPIIVCSKIDEILPVIRHEIKLSGVTQQELADHMGLAYVTINRMLNGKTAMSIEQLYTALGYLGIGVALAPPKTPRHARNLSVREEKRKAPADLGVTVQDLFRAGKLSAGDILESVPGTWNAVAEVGLGGVLILEDGNEYTSPSSAAREARGGTVTNGWTFWALNGRSLDSMRKEMLEAK